MLIQATKSFFAFSALASFVYILNDLLDVSNDRKHPTKSMRPFASGAVSLEIGVFLSFILLSIYVFLVLWLPFKFTLLTVIYLALNFLYSFKLKKFFVLDAFVLASFYSLRLLGGSAAIDVKASHWLIIFSTFFFLSLGFLKRYTDLLFVSQKAGQHQLEGRNYQIQDTQLLMITGVASGFVSILVFAQYIYGPESLHYYPQSEFLWGVLFCMLYWVTKIWFKASRGLVYDDPVKYALKDRESIILGITTLAFIIMAAWK
jgi:4-hydroxybenzoate polyprenyltransferase